MEDSGIDLGSRDSQVCMSNGVERWWHPDRVALIDRSHDRASIQGLSVPEIEQIAANGAALLAIGGPHAGEPPSFLAEARRRIDHDPGYTPLWAEEYGFDASHASLRDDYEVSVAAVDLRLCADRNVPTCSGGEAEAGFDAKRTAEATLNTAWRRRRFLSQHYASTPALAEREARQLASSHVEASMRYWAARRAPVNS